MITYIPSNTYRCGMLLMSIGILALQQEKTEKINHKQSNKNKRKTRNNNKIQQKIEIPIKQQQQQQ